MELDEYVAQALFAGASGFLGKDVSADELLAGIRTVAVGDALLSPLAAEGQSNHEIAGKLVVIVYQSGLVRPVPPPH